MAGLIEHPQGSYVLTSIVGFLLLFRSNLAYNRFWEGRTCALRQSTPSSGWVGAGCLAGRTPSVSACPD